MSGPYLFNMLVFAMYSWSNISQCNFVLNKPVLSPESWVHELWTPYKGSVSLHRCSPAFSLRDKNFQKVPIRSSLSQKSVQGSTICHHLQIFLLLHVTWMQWSEQSETSAFVPWTNANFTNIDIYIARVSIPKHVNEYFLQKTLINSYEYLCINE